MNTTGQKSSSRHDPYLDSARLNALQLMLCARLDELLDELGVDVGRSKKMVFGPCPVHGGDNPSGLNLYTDGDYMPGYWRCNTRRCHDTFKKTILGFVRGVLSHQKYGWPSNKTTVSWRDTVDWCCKFVGQPIHSIKVNYKELERNKFTRDVETLTKRPEQSKQGSSRAVVRQFLKIPSPYFVSRGWSPEVLDKYDVGDYPVAGKPLSNRAVAPIYDNDHKLAVGFTGRSIFDECLKCHRWHQPDESCPATNDRAAWGKAAKWFNHQFSKDSYLYGYWFAQNAIRDNHVAVLVEGPGDVWRLSEAGIDCGVALLGTELSDEQQVILEMSGAMDVVVLMDMDNAGRNGKEQLTNSLKRLFRLHFPLLTKKDVGDLSVEDVKKELLPIVEKLKR